VAFLAIGRILRPWGVQGEVKVEILTDFPERFRLLRTVYLGQGRQPYTLERARRHGHQMVLKFKECRSRLAAEALRDQLVQIPVEEAMPLEEGEYYEHQIIGLDVVTREGEKLGRVTEVLFTGANEVYVVHGRGREILLPAIEDVILEIDLTGGRMVVALLEGLL